MRAEIGDRLIVHGAHIDDPVRDGEVLEAHGTDGGPPFLVRWSDNGHETLYFPGPDATIEHAHHATEG